MQYPQTSSRDGDTNTEGNYKMTKYEKIDALCAEIDKLARQRKDYSKQRAEVEAIVAEIAEGCRLRKLAAQGAQ